MYELESFLQKYREEEEREVTKLKERYKNLQFSFSNLPLKHNKDVKFKGFLILNCIFVFNM